MHSAFFPSVFAIPVVAIIGGLAVGAIAIITEHRRKQALLEERRLMIEKGLTPPPLNEQVLDVGSPMAGTQSAIESSLKAGIITLFVGLGLIAFFLVMRFVVVDDFALIPRPVIALTGPAGALVSLIGIGNLVYFWVANRRAANSR